MPDQTVRLPHFTLLLAVSPKHTVWSARHKRGWHPSWLWQGPYLPSGMAQVPVPASHTPPAWVHSCSVCGAAPALTKNKPVKAPARSFKNVPFIFISLQCRSKIKFTAWHEYRLSLLSHTLPACFGKRERNPPTSANRFAQRQLQPSCVSQTVGDLELPLHPVLKLAAPVPIRVRQTMRQRQAADEPFSCAVPLRVGPPRVRSLCAVAQGLPPAVIRSAQGA